MAQQLIESLTTEFDPSKYRDEYRERGARDDRAQGRGRGDRGAAPPDEEPEEVPDLMAALEASIAGVQAPEQAEDAKRKAKPKPQVLVVNGSKSKAKPKPKAKSTAKK